MNLFSDNMDSFLNKMRLVKRETYYYLYDQFNRILSTDSSTIINDQEIRFIGLQRSGNHAIINWIIKQKKEENPEQFIANLNNVPVQYNPYRFYYNHFPKNKFKQDAFRKFTKKDLLIYSYEDYSLEKITDKIFEEKHDFYLGKSANRYDTLIIRDPFNFFASRFKMIDDSSNNTKVFGKRVIDLWISYAKEFLGETNYLTQTKVVVNYNEWFSSEDYRRTIAKQLGLKFSDIGFEDVRGQGGGSSFDQRGFHGKASQMNVLQRWQVYQNDPRFLDIFKDERLWHYSKKIFGQIEGTDVLLNKINVSL